MSNYDTARPISGSAASRYLLDNSFDYFAKRSSNDYSRNSDYTHGNKNYEGAQYNTTFDSYTSDSMKNDYKYRYDGYGSDNKSYLRNNPNPNPKKIDLRHTTNVLPSYIAEQRKRDFGYSPRKDNEIDMYDRRHMKTTYEVPASSKITKDWRDTSPKQNNYDKADYLSPPKYDKMTSSTALSPNHYNKYDNNAKLNAIMAKINKLPSPGSPKPLSPTSRTSPTPRDQDKKRQQLMEKYKKYINTTPKYGNTSDSYTQYTAEKSKIEDYPPLYSSSSYTDPKKYKKEDDFTTKLLTDSKSGDLFKKKKEYRDVKLPEQDKELNKRISGYTTALKKQPEPLSPTYLSDSKINKEKVSAESTKFSSNAAAITSRDNKEEKNKHLSNPSYGLSTTTLAKLQGEVTLKDFQIGKNKGEGKFGQVFVARHKQTASLYALKKIPKDTIKQHMMEDQLILQIKLQAYLDHPNILKLYTFFADDKNIYLVLQYMEEGTLFEYLKRRKDRMTEKEVSRRIAEISHAIKYLHDLDIAHRDIKPENIVLSHGMAKLCDFGWATRCTNRRKTYCGTFDYVAPEILQGKQYDWCVDLWCIGVLTYQLLMGKVPFYNISRKQTMKKILSCGSDPLVFSSDISWEARDFVECLIKKAPEERRRADQLLSHPFLEKHLELEYLNMKL